MSVNLPILCQDDGFWGEKVILENAGIIFSESLKKENFEVDFYKEEVKGVYWETEKLTSWLSRVI